MSFYVTVFYRSVWCESMSVINLSLICVIYCKWMWAELDVSLFVLFCMLQSGCWRCWSLQVSGILSPQLIRLWANWVAVLWMVFWRLSQNYPWIIPENYTVPVRPCPGLGSGIAGTSVCACRQEEIWTLQPWFLCHGACIFCVFTVQSFWLCCYIRVMEYVNPNQPAICHR